MAKKKYKIDGEQEYTVHFHDKYFVDFKTKIANNKEIWNRHEYVGALAEQINTRKSNYWRKVWTKTFKNWEFLLALLFIITLVILSIVFSVGKTAVPDGDARPSNTPANPSWKYPFGLGLHGENYFTEIWIGTRTTLYFMLVVIALQLLIGLIIGCIWGFYRKSDILFINVTNIIQIVPSLLFIVFGIFLFGKGFWPVVAAVTIQSWITFAMATRVQVMYVKNREYNIMSGLLGTPSSKIITKNILPKVMPVLVSVAAFAIPDAIALDATLSYLNFGFVDGSINTSLGFIIQSVSMTTSWMEFPGLIVFPMLVISLLSFAMFLISKIIADNLNPKSHT